MQIVWFKRDLRAHDHRALCRAARHGPVLPLYVAEPDLWAEPDMAGRHWMFVAEALAQLHADLARAGQPLIIRTGEITDILAQLASKHPIKILWSHEETGNGWTFARDQKVADWCRLQGIRWNEVQNHGVVRRIKTRNGWAKGWDQFMAEPQCPTPALEPLNVDPGKIPDPSNLGLPADHCPDRQNGTRAAGLERLDSFLHNRGRSYRSDMSSPLTGATACSRLSPHLAWGTLSLREVAQATWDRQRALKAGAEPARSGWRGSMRSFNGRLHWHCHFIQKLEDEPKLEFDNLHSAYDGIRPSTPDQARIDAWANGQTGLPFVDACMRSLRATGWLNFRMRAMVMATASYHLWLDWRAPGLQLARYFTDYEPGIHWPQVQMQSGTTGINTIRIYNPVKQGQDQDPTGAFTRHWVPELRDIPDVHLQEPWKAENAAKILGKAYPEPVVDHLSAARAAREAIWAVRRDKNFGPKAKAIQTKHGSRKSGIPNRGQRLRKTNTTQLDLPLE